ncbi:MAG: DsrE family protein [Ignavibacteriales bacterium]|nr:DsrE family protein [Ignavibacteriales bacterium]
MKILFLINDAPYGTEKFYNACRLAMTVQKEHSEVEVNVFLMADSVTGALVNQNAPQGYYNIERMLKSIINKGGKVKLCGGCIDARGIASLQFIEGCTRSNMSELAQWSFEAGKVFTF